MIARGFKPVAWVACVGAAALGCYMLSLQVAAERANLASLDRRIVSARQQIRSLQTELGTRGRIQQLEAWNDDVLALSAPVSGQFVEGQVSLARFDTRQAEPIDTGNVRMASADAATAVPAPQLAAQPRRAIATDSAATPLPNIQQARVQRTSLTSLPQAEAATTAPRPAAVTVPARPRSVTAQPTTPVRISPIADAGTTQANGARAPRRATAEASTRPVAVPVRTAASKTAPPAVRPAAPLRTASAETGPRATQTRNVSPPARLRTTAGPSTRPSALLGERALRDLRTTARSERDRGTGN